MGREKRGMKARKEGNGGEKRAEWIGEKRRMEGRKEENGARKEGNEGEKRGMGREKGNGARKEGNGGEKIPQNKFLTTALQLVYGNILDVFITTVLPSCMYCVHKTKFRSCYICTVYLVISTGISGEAGVNQKSWGKAQNVLLADNFSP